MLDDLLKGDGVHTARDASAGACTGHRRLTYGDYNFDFRMEIERLLAPQI